MEVTDSAASELDLFYTEKLLPLVEAAIGRGLILSDAAVNAVEPVETYYVDRVNQDRYLHQIKLNELEVQLAEYWRSEGKPEFAELSSELVRIAKTLKDEEVSDEVSPFIYAMF